MKRELYVSTPSVQQLNITAPVNKGGTGGTTSAEVAVSLGGVLIASIGQPSGPVKQEVGGGVAKTALPSSVPPGVTVDGPQDFYVGSSNILTITNYDANTSYAVSASAGTISINGGAITFVAPGTPQSVTLTIGGRQVAANVIALAPVRPKIVTPTYGSTNQAINGLQITGSAFAIPSGTPSHQQSDWQLASDPAFNTIVSQSLNDTVNKTTWTVNGLSNLTVYYVRVRYKDTNLGYSNWSNGDKFTTASSAANEEAKLIGNDAAASNQFGTSICLSSDGLRCIVGSPQSTVSGNANAGAAFIFIRSGTTWTLEQKLIPSVLGASVFFGASVSFTTDTTRVAIGAWNQNTGSTTTGNVYVFTRSGSVWTVEQRLIASDAASNDFMGYSCAISGDGTRVVAGAYLATDNSVVAAGKAYVFLRTGVTWAQERKFIATVQIQSATFGLTVAINTDGSRVAIGSPSDTASGITTAGLVYVFSRSGTTWTLEQTLSASDKMSGGRFGNKVSMTLDSTRLAIGAPNMNSGAVTNAGQAYVFLRASTTWTQEAILSASDKATADTFGNAIAISSDGTQIAVGAAQGSSNPGSVYAYSRTGTVWAQSKKIQASDKINGGYFGTTVAISGDNLRIGVGSVGASAGAVASAGAAYIYV